MAVLARCVADGSAMPTDRRIDEGEAEASAVWLQTVFGYGYRLEPFDAHALADER